MELRNKRTCWYQIPMSIYHFQSGRHEALVLLLLHGCAGSFPFWREVRNKGEVIMANEKVNCTDYIKGAERIRSSAFSLFKFWTSVSYRSFDLCIIQEL